MNVLIIGANGYLGPHVVEALAPHYHLRITDIKPAPSEVRTKYSGHEFRDVDATSAEQVLDAAKGMDAILNLSVVRPHRKLAFYVNMLGCYNIMRAAVQHGVRRVINTGPHYTIAGPSYEWFDHGIGPDVPTQSGTYLYSLTKSLGQEVCRAFTENKANDVYVLDFLFYGFCFASEVKRGVGAGPFTVEWSDAGESFRRGLEVDLAKLPSKCEVFYIFANSPHGIFDNEKTERVLGFKPKHDIMDLWRKKL